MSTSSSPLLSLRLNKGAGRRLRAGHLWVYSNEVDTAVTPLKTMPAGSEVVVEDASGKFVAMAVVNPGSLICARLYRTRQMSRSVTDGSSTTASTTVSRSLFF